MRVFGISEALARGRRFVPAASSPAPGVPRMLDLAVLIRLCRLISRMAWRYRRCPKFLNLSDLQVDVLGGNADVRCRGPVAGGHLPGFFTYCAPFLEDHDGSLTVASDGVVQPGRLAGLIFESGLKGEARNDFEKVVCRVVHCGRVAAFC